MSAQRIFVTGTDTGVGKTFITCQLVKALKRAGHSVGVCKPFATGASEVDGHLVSDDVVALKEAAEVKDNHHAINPVIYKSPLAPNWAARIENKDVDLQAAKDSLHRLSEKYDYLIIEGIGGIKVPITDTYCVLDLVAEYKFPTLIVAHTGLGTLNHILLTADVLRAKGVPIRGIVLNGALSATSTLAEKTNTENLKAILDVPIFGGIPHKPIGKQLDDVIDSIRDHCFPGAVE